MLVLHKTCCVSSSEPSRQDGSDEGPQHMFQREIRKLSLNYHQILLLSRSQIMKTFILSDGSKEHLRFNVLFSRISGIISGQ